MGTRTDRTNNWTIDYEIQPERTLAEVFNALKERGLRDGKQIEDLRRLIPGYVLRMTIEDIERSPPESHENIFNLNSPGKLATAVFGSNLFRRIVGLSHTPEIWRTNDESVSTTQHLPEPATNRQINWDFGNDVKVTSDMDSNSKQLYFIVNQRQEYTLREAISATFGKAIPNDLRRIIAQLKAVHLDTEIAKMPETFRRPEVNEEGQKAIEWLRPKVASFVLSNDPPKAWFTQTGSKSHRPADINFIALDEPEIFLKKQYYVPPPQKDLYLTATNAHSPAGNNTQRDTRIMRRRATTKSFYLSNGSVRRLARRGGVKRMSATVRDEVSDALKTFVGQVVGRAVLYTDNANRRTVRRNDVLFALKHLSRTLYL